MSRGQRITVFEGWVPNCLYLSSKNIGDQKQILAMKLILTFLKTGYKKRCYGIVTKRKYATVLDNATYHSGLKYKTPSMSATKHHIVTFTQDLYQRSLTRFQNYYSPYSNIQKQFIIKEIAQQYRHGVLRLPPYRCRLNGIELVRARLKEMVRKHNVTPSVSSNGCHIWRDFVSEIDVNFCKKCVRHTMPTEADYLKLYVTF